jgi:hypothetical protein
MRKFVIGFVSLCAVLGAYLLYNRLSSSPSIDTDQQVDIMESAIDANAVGFDSEVGKIGDVGVGPTQMAYYNTFNKETNEIEREFGFEKLLSEARDIWDIEQPYMNIYRRNFKCYITADKGKVQVETAVGRTTPKDATFSSNVVVRILSGPPDDVKESFVYLDNFVFLSERSRLSTANPEDPVKFVSKDIRMDGTGLELVYNEQSERLEYFEIKDLESLHLEGPQAAMFTTDKTSKDNSQSKTQELNEPLIVDDSPKAEAPTPEDQPQDKQEEGVYYKCTFRKKVLVNTPDELIFAGDKLCINDIFWSKSSSDQPAEDDAEDMNDVKTVAETAEPDRQADDSVSERQVTAPAPPEPNVPPEQFKSIVLTCQGGFVVLPKDSVRAQEDAAENETENAISAVQPPSEFDDQTRKTRFLTRRIDYNRTTGDGIADGLSELTFYAGSSSGSDANEAPVPVKVTSRKGANFSKASNKVIFEGDCLVTMPQSGLTRPKDVTFSAPEITVNLPEDKSKQPDMFAAGPAELVFYMEDANSMETNIEPLPVTVNAQKQARFLAASNQIIFEGDSRCTMFREDPNALVKYMLISEQITVDLPADMNDSSSGPAAGIKHLTATGDVVRLATTKTAKAEGAFAEQFQNANSAKLLSGVELKCSRFDYDADRQLFVATGPGEIKLINDGAPEPNEQVGRLSLRRPCYGLVENFDTLKYFLKENRIVADAKTEKMNINHISIIDGKYGQPVKASASHVEAFFYETPEGQTELLTLTATGGIDYNDPAKDHHFIGSDLFYDHETAIVKVKGDESQPCYYNGVLAVWIEMNVKTGKVEAEIVEPSTLQINR